MKKMTPRGRTLRTIAAALLLVLGTAGALAVGVRTVVRRELTAQRITVDEAIAELDLRLALTFGIVACLTTAVVLATERLREGRSPSPPLDGARSERDPKEELEQMRQRLARTERIAARREVAQKVAHEIKNPLAPIRTAVETLRRMRERNSPEFEEYFDEATKTVLAEVRRIAAIVTEFSKYARMPPPSFARVNLGELLRSIGSLHDAPELTGGARVVVLLATEATLVADANQLNQVFTNLVQNGIESAKAAGELPRVTLRLSSRGADEVCVRVEDNGPGVEPTIRARLFDPYVTTKREGTGLGLAIVQTIVHEHGGEVRLVDDEPTGAAFEVLLPLEGPAPLAEPPAITVDPHPP